MVGWLVEKTRRKRSAWLKQRCWNRGDDCVGAIPAHFYAHKLSEEMDSLRPVSHKGMVGLLNERATSAQDLKSHGLGNITHPPDNPQWTNVDLNKWLALTTFFNLIAISWRHLWKTSLQRGQFWMGVHQSGGISPCKWLSFISTWSEISRWKCKRCGSGWTLTILLGETKVPRRDV